MICEAELRSVVRWVEGLMQLPFVRRTEVLAPSDNLVTVALLDRGRASKRYLNTYVQKIAAAEAIF